jgi:hypothetical protein
MKKDGDLAFRKKWIQWVLDFAQMDLNSLPLSRMKTLKEEVAYFCSERPLEGDWEEFEENLHLAPVTPGDNEGVTEIDDGVESVNLSEIQKYAIDFLRALNRIHKSRREDRAIERKFVRHLPEMSSYIVSPFPGTFEIRRNPTTSNPENWLILNFIGLIERFETYPIKKCKGCDRFFLHLTKIEKVYCTSSCAARSIQREKREKLYQDPKKHKTFLKKWRKYQKKRYDEKLKARLGTNIKVSRRKRIKQRKED